MLDVLKQADSDFKILTVSKFLHCLLAPVVFQNAHVLKDSLTSIKKLDEVWIPARSQSLIHYFDVIALYPSIDLERGLKLMSWFLIAFCNNFQDKVKNRYFLYLASSSLTAKFLVRKFALICFFNCLAQPWELLLQWCTQIFIYLLLKQKLLTALMFAFDSIFDRLMVESLYGMGQIKTFKCFLMPSIA